MVNITKIKALAKQSGIKTGYLCEQLGVNHTYLSNVATGKNSMSDERICKIAEILHTTYEYLTDQTDDPAPPEERTETPLDPDVEETLNLAKQLAKTEAGRAKLRDVTEWIRRAVELEDVENRMMKK